MGNRQKNRVEISIGSQFLAHSFKMGLWASGADPVGEILKATDGLKYLVVIAFSHIFCKM